MDWNISAAGPVPADIPRSAGIHDLEVSLDGSRRARFTLSLPPGIENGTPRPLVLVLHYAGQPTRFYGRPLLTGLVEPALRPLGAVMIAPEALGGQWQEEANEAWVLALLAAVERAYPIAVEQRVVTGYSMGAIGTWHFVTHYPENFSCGVPIAGFPRRDLRVAVPVHAFHAARDELFQLADLREAIAAARAAGSRIELTEAEVNGHYDVNGYGPALAGAAAWIAQQWRGTTA